MFHKCVLVVFCTFWLRSVIQRALVYPQQLYFPLSRPQMLICCILYKNMFKLFTLSTYIKALCLFSQPKTVFGQINAIQPLLNELIDRFPIKKPHKHTPKKHNIISMPIWPTLQEKRIYIFRCARIGLLRRQPVCFPNTIYTL